MRIKIKTLLKVLLCVIYAIVYVFVLNSQFRIDPANKTGDSWSILLLTYSIIPVLLVLILYLFEKNKISFYFKDKYYKASRILFIVIPLILVVAMPLMDIVNYYFNWGYITPGTWASFGLMMLCYLLIADNINDWNIRTVIVSILGGYLFLSGWELAYLVRYTINFWHAPLSLYDAVVTATHVLTTLPLAIGVYVKYKVRTDWKSVILILITFVLLAIVAQTGQFWVDWDGVQWVSVGTDGWVFYVNRFTKVTLAFAVSMLLYDNVRINEKIRNN